MRREPYNPTVQRAIYLKFVCRNPDSNTQMFGRTLEIAASSHKQSQISKGRRASCCAHIITRSGESGAILYYRRHWHGPCLILCHSQADEPFAVVQTCQTPSLPGIMKQTAMPRVAALWCCHYCCFGLLAQGHWDVVAGKQDSSQRKQPFVFMPPK